MRRPQAVQEGWYLMSVRDLEIELAALRDPAAAAASNAQRLSVPEALEFRNNGNLPDAFGRTLRLVLEVDGQPLSVKRLGYEADYHAEPSWRREGSKPINVVPIPATHRASRPRAASEVAWWDQPDVAELEREWQRSGAIGTLRIPAEYRSFILKTIASLRSAGIEVTIASVAASLARWLSVEQVSEIRRGLDEANA